MRRRLLLPLVAVLALPAVAGEATAAAPSRSTVKPGYVYSGRTTQGIPVHLARAVGATRWFRYRARMTCSDGSTFLDDFFSDDVTLRHNRFSLGYTSNAGAVTTKVTGTLSGVHATGTVRIIERFSEQAVNGVTPLSKTGSIVCDSKTVRWTASA